jgi:hypothetical protein
MAIRGRATLVSVSLSDALPVNALLPRSRGPKIVAAFCAVGGESKFGSMSKMTVEVILKLEQACI